MGCAVHWRARKASFPSKSFCSFLIKQEKQRGKRSVARAADWLNRFFLQYKITNCPDYRTISQDICTLFARHLHSTLGSWIIIKSTCIWNPLKSSYLKNDSRKPSDCCTFEYNRLHRSPPPSYFHLDINFFTHGTLSSSPFILLPTLWLACSSSTSSLLPTGCQYFLHNKLSLFPFPISHPSIHSFIDPLVLLSLQPSSHPLSTTLFLSFFLPVAANEVRWSAKKIATGEKCQPIQGICYRDITLINLAKYQSLYAGGLKSNFIN